MLSDFQLNSHIKNISSTFSPMLSRFYVIVIRLVWSLCLYVITRTATWGIFLAHVSLSRGAAPMIRLNTTLLFCLAVPLKPTLSSPTLWLSAATAVHAGLTLMSAHTEPAWMEQSVPSLLGVSTHILATATMLSLFDSHVLVPITRTLF